MIERFVQVLRKAGFDPTPEDVADLLWLASFLPPPPAVEAPAPDTELTPGPGETKIPSGEVVTAETPEGETLPPAPEGETEHEIPPTGEVVETGPLSEGLVEGEAAAEPPAAGLYALPEDQLRPPQEGLRFQTPGGVPLPGALALGRAMRPLSRRVPSLHHIELDEDATVQRIADGGTWAPVMRPALTRWLELDIVVDESPSMVIWQQTVYALRRLLERLGAFRNIRIWGMVSEPNPDPEKKTQCLVRLHAGFGALADREQSRNPKELNDQRGNRMILVVSDCIAPAWYTGEIGRLLAGWGRTNLVALVHMLPEYLWTRTGLGNGIPLYLRSPRMGAPNRSWESRRAVRSRTRAKLPPGARLPVTALSPDTVGTWAQAVGGKSGLWVYGYWLPTDAKVEEQRQQMEAAQAGGAAAPEPTPEQVLQLFNNSASPLARQLAGYFSVAPLSLPVMRLVQSAMLPESRQLHLAEVFLSGLLKRQDGDGRDIWKEKVRYEFLPGVREKLRATIYTSESVEVLRRVSQYIFERQGRSVEFLSWLRDPSAVGDLDFGLEEEPFALIAADTLRALGGDYQQLAERLQEQAHLARPGERMPARPEAISLEERPPVEEAEAQLVVVRTPFEAKVHGFQFVNRFESSREGGVKVLGIRLNVGDTLYGLGGGMCFAALDYFHAGQPVPPYRSPDEIDEKLRYFLTSRQSNSSGLRVLTRTATYAASADAELRRRTLEEFSKLRSLLDRKQPAVLVLIRGKEGVKDLARNHYAVASGYQSHNFAQERDELTLFLYDPNHPGLEVSILMRNLSHPEEMQLSQSTGEPLRGFLVVDYKPATPPKIDLAEAREAPAVSPKRAFDRLLAQLQTLQDESKRSEIVSQALSLAYAMGEPGDEARSLVALLPHVSGLRRAEVQEAAFSSIMLIQPPDERLQPLLDLLPMLDQDHRYEALLEAFDVAGQVEPPARRLEVLISLLPQLDEQRRPEALYKALEAAQQIETPNERLEALFSLLPYMDEEQRQEVLNEMLRLADKLETRPRFDMLMRLMEISPQESIENEIMFTAASLPPERDWLYKLLSLRAQLSDYKQTSLDRLILQATRALERSEDRLEIYLALLPSLEQEQRSQAADEAFSLAVTVALPGERRLETFFTLLPYLDAGSKRSALEQVLMVARQYAPPLHLKTLTRLLEYADPERLGRLQDEALEVAARIEPPEARLNALIELLPELDADHRPMALDACLDVPRSPSLSGESRLDAYFSLLPHLDGERMVAVQDEVLSIARQYQPLLHYQALLRLLEHAPQERSASLLGEALEVAARVEPLGMRLLSLISLLPRLDETQKPHALDEILLTASKLSPERPWIEQLLALRPQFDERRLQQADEVLIRAAGNLKKAAERLEVHLALLPVLDLEKRGWVMAQIFDMIARMTRDFERVETINKIAPYLEGLPESHLNQALTLVRMIKAEDLRYNALLALAQHLPEDWLEMTLQVAHEMSDARYRAEALGALARYFPPDVAQSLLVEAQVVANSIEDEAVRTAIIDEVQRRQSALQQAPSEEPARERAYRLISDRQEGAIFSVAVTPDGRLGLSGCELGTLKLWDLESGEMLHSIYAHTAAVRAVAVSPDGGTAVTASYDGTLKVWDLSSYENLRTLVGHEGQVRAVAFTPDGRRVLSASQDHTLRLWELGSGSELRALRGHSDWVNAVAVSSDGRYALSGSDDMTVRWWDLRSGETLSVMRDHRAAVLAVAVSPNSSRMASADESGHVNVWDLEPGSLRLRSTPWHTLELGTPVFALAHTPVGAWILAACGDGSLRTLSDSRDGEIRSVPAHGSAVRSVAIDPQGRFAFSGAADGILKLWDLSTWRALKTTRRAEYQRQYRQEQVRGQVSRLVSLRRRVGWYEKFAPDHPLLGRYRADLDTFEAGFRKQLAQLKDSDPQFVAEIERELRQPFELPASFETGHALVIGVGKYAHLERDFPVSVRDGQALAEVLLGPCAYPAEQVTQLYEDQATRSNILSQLDQLTQRLKPDDTLLVYYAGISDYDREGEFYLTTHDTRFERLDGRQRVVPGTALGVGEMAEMLRRLPVRRLLLLVNQPVPRNAAISWTRGGEGRALMSACGPDQQAYIARGENGLTVFGQALVEALSGEVPQAAEEGYITLSRLYDAVYYRVKEQAFQWNREQTPELFMAGVSGPFRVGLYQGEPLDAASAVSGEPSAPVHDLEVDADVSQVDAPPPGVSISGEPSGDLVAGFEEPQMVRIPAGPFLMGSNEQQIKQAVESGLAENLASRERPQHKVELPEYFIGKYPVTNAEYRVFITDTIHRPPAGWEGGDMYPQGRGKHPVVNITWEDAQAYCRWLVNMTGKPYRLPTEAEWEKAARGPDGRIYPWGDKFDSERCNTRESSIGGTTPVGEYLGKGDSPYGVIDMVGNVWEWTGTIFREYPYNPGDGRDDPRKSERIVLRGGSFYSDRVRARCTSRYSNNPSESYGAFGGFRVAFSTPPAGSETPDKATTQSESPALGETMAEPEAAQGFEIERYFAGLYSLFEELPLGKEKENVRKAILTLESQAERGAEADEKKIEMAFRELENVAPALSQYTWDALDHPPEGMIPAFMEAIGATSSYDPFSNPYDFAA